MNDTQTGIDKGPERADMQYGGKNVALANGLRKTSMRVIVMKEVNHRVVRGIGWVGKAALLCLGILGMLALLVVMSVLTAVMLMATVFPATAVRHKRAWEPTR